MKRYQINFIKACGFIALFCLSLFVSTEAAKKLGYDLTVIESVVVCIVGVIFMFTGVSLGEPKINETIAVIFLRKIFLGLFVVAGASLNLFVTIEGCKGNAIIMYLMSGETLIYFLASALFVVLTMVFTAFYEIFMKVKII